MTENEDIVEGTAGAVLLSSSYLVVIDKNYNYVSF